MNRKGFMARLLAALGVGAFFNPAEAEVSVPEPGPSPPAPPDSLLDRLKHTIDRHRANGEEVNFFHTNWDTMTRIAEEFGGRFFPLVIQEYQTIEVYGVRWWRVDEMVEDEILVSADGIEPPCPRCGGTGVIPVAGSLGDMSRYLGYRSDGSIPSSEGLVYEDRPCPRCSDVFGRSLVDNEDLIQLQREKNRLMTAKMDREAERMYSLFFEADA